MEYTDIELKNEKWRDIFGYDGMYQVSDFMVFGSVVTHFRPLSPLISDLLRSQGFTIKTMTLQSASLNNNKRILKIR